MKKKKSGTFEKTQELEKNSKTSGAFKGIFKKFRELCKISGILKNFRNFKKFQKFLKISGLLKFLGILKNFRKF